MQLREIAYEIVKILTQKEKTLAVAESCTGGLISSTITDVPGASKVFLCGLVTYATEMKKIILGIEDKVFSFGVISPEMAKNMAEATKKITSADYTIATTGNLGPSSMEGKPVGLVYIAVATEKDTFVKELILKGDRIQNKKDTTAEALKFCLEVIK
ncbi:CinA family protein [Thermodesulfovibrio hydrogeniphilus]